MTGTRWVGSVRMDVSHLGPSSVAGIHEYAVSIVPSSGGRWHHEGEIPAEPTEQGFDAVAAHVASSVVLGAPQTPETFGTEQTWLDLAELLDAGLARPEGPWPVRRSEHGAAVIVDVGAPGTTASMPLPMRVEVAHRAVVAIEPMTASDERLACVVLAQLATHGEIHLESPLQGWISNPDPGAIERALSDQLGGLGFSGKTIVGERHLEFSHGECRVGGWEHRTAQIEFRFVAEEDKSAAVLVEILAELSLRHDVADIDVDTTRGGFHVLASVTEPMGFLEVMRDAVSSSEFRGAADLSAAGRWRFDPDGAVRLDQGVPL